jgi:ABC-2 type transport system permease protein
MKKWKKNILKRSSSEKKKRFGYRSMLTVVVVLVLLGVNLVANLIPERYRMVDISGTQLYEISEISTELLQGLEKEVTCTVFANEESCDERIRIFLEKYVSLSKNISVSWVDPDEYPDVLTEYDVSEDTILVSCEETAKSTTISFDDIIVVDWSYYYYTGSATESEFDAEGQLSSAVYYVTNDVSTQIYRTSGHGESTFSTTISNMMDKQSYTVTEWNLLMNTTVPEDCELLLMYAPTKDLAEAEVEGVRSYLSDGGNVMLVLGDTNLTELPNLSALLLEYGMEGVDGYIADPSQCYQGNYYNIFPSLSVSGEMASGISSKMVLLSYARGMNLVDPAREEISVSSFMSTTSNGYAITQEEQLAGQYVLGAVAVETIGGETEDEETSDTETEEGKEESTDNSTDEEELVDETTDDVDETEEVSEDTTEEEVSEEKEARFTVITAGSLIDVQITDSFSQLENTTVFLNAVRSNFDGIENLAIESKSLLTEYNTVQHPGLLSFFVIFGIPCMVILFGFVVWYQRRKA